MRRSVLLAGGGTTGHVAPLLALAECLRRRDSDLDITVLGTTEGLEARLVPQAGLPLAVVPKVPLPRRPSADLLRLPGRLRSAVTAASSALTTSQAQVVVGFGGYVAMPAYLAARKRRVPIVVHEANARPGIANRLGARFTPYVACAFPGTPLPGAQVVGMPLRRQITELDRAHLRPEGYAHFGLDPARPTVLVTGGSLGAQRLNESMAAIAGPLVGSGAQVLHLTGRGKSVNLSPGTGFGSTEAELRDRYVVREYLDRMDLGFAIADLVICRAGAGTVCELTALGLPAIYVPLPIGNGEQRFNAEPVVQAGGGVLVSDAEFTPERAATEVLGLITDADRRDRMANHAASFGITDGAERLADIVAHAAGWESS